MNNDEAIMTNLEDRLCFTEQDALSAWHKWGCNCGPAALAFCLGVPLDEVRPLLPEFERRGYVNVTMMKHALQLAHRRFERVEYWPVDGLVRIQWTGPWTAAGANPRWAARYTHWIATYDTTPSYYVFDVNGGLRSLAAWRRDIVPAITDEIKRADGGWRPTHLWEVRRRSRDKTSTSSGSAK